ncbi:MAG: hypothetical protein KF715_06815 [Candidatus Didemnitutus sp.]|nr:hypothetical protein [Candidatus Didemnitutus sp.]
MPTEPPTRILRFSDPMRRWETVMRTIIQIGFVIMGLKGIHDNTFMGQDWGIHQSCVQQTLEDPKLLFHYDVTSRPLIYWLAACGQAVTDGAYGFQLATLVIVLFNALSLGFLHDALRWSVERPILRISALGLFAFLPVTSIATTVFAADNLTVAFFALTGWSLIRCLHAVRRGRQAGFALLGGLALMLAQFQKFTFLLLPVAVAVVILVDWWTAKESDWRRNGWIFGCMILAPLLVGVGLDRAARAQLSHLPSKHSYDWDGTGEMTWRTILWPRAEDGFLLSAPTYWEPSDRQEANGDSPENEAVRRQNGAAQRLLQHNRYSYPALLHLGIFSDVLNFSHPSDDKFRPEPQRTFARGSVRLGLVFSVATVLACVILAGRLVYSAARRCASVPRGTLVWAIGGAAWYFPLVIQLPYIHHAYEWGYWLPRLVLPAIWSAVAITFTEADRWVGDRLWPQLLIAGISLTQISLGLGSILYWS